ncbi:MAG: hypothetical protein ACFE0S_05550 [Rhodospirillales bacterium]
MISIRPCWVRKIVSGEKTYEFRRRPPFLDHHVEAFIYESRPVQAIRWKCRIGPTVSAPPIKLWGICADQSGMQRETFDAYFDGCETAHALEVSSVTALGRPLAFDELQEKFDIRPPQSWRRIPEALSAQW